MQPEAVPIPQYYGEQIQRPNNGAKNQEVIQMQDKEKIIRDIIRLR